MSIEIKVDFKIDATGQTCPGPIIAAKKQADKMEAGQVMLLISDCPGTEPDITAWAELTDKEILEIRQLDKGAKAFYFRKGDAWHTDRTLDLRGQQCPDPIVLAGRELQQMTPGQTLKLTTDCRGVVDDIKIWTKATRHQLLGIAPGPFGSDVSYINC